MNSATNDTYIDHHNPLVKEIDYIDRIKQNVINLLKTKMKDNKTTRIGLSYLIDPVTVKDIGFFADWINKIYRDENLKPDFIRFAPAIDYFSHSQYPQEFFNEAVEKFDNEAKAKIEETGAQVTLYKHRFNSINEKKTYKRCLGSYFFLETTCDGTVFTCCETAFFPGYNMGNLAQHEYAAIQKSKMFNAVKKRIDKNGLISCPTFCKPHNINKILCDIDAILDKNTAGGNTIELISKWLDGLHKYWDYELPANSKFKKPQIVAF
jgi:sulfatase maturation enzyme AslB (radical SAM superfamily)